MYLHTDTNRLQTKAELFLYVWKAWHGPVADS